jgi:hypothetical protein
MNNSLTLIRKLVDDFRANEEAFLSPSYQESQVRQDFVDKFFTALGWDVTHERQKNPYEQEVKIETNVKTSGSQRRADYAFFIAPNFRDVKFFVEAKKPSRGLANLDDYYQTIRYGWNSNTPIAVLTDFEELHVLDCRYKPDRDTALDRKIEVFHYSDYANEETFARIFYLFGREAVGNGSLEKRAAELPKPRGKAAQKGALKVGYQQVDEAFLVALDGYRDALAHTFKAKNPDLNGEELTEAVQRTLDRLVFIRFLEDKQIEDPTIIDFRSKASAWKAFVAYCKSLEPKYNGLIFKQHRIIDGNEPSTGSGRGFVPPDDEKFGEICTELSERESPYDFDKIPISILGSIYERFLGKVVSATEKRVKIIEKPEVRKAGGVYYTPEYIVRYIVKETVGKMIEGKTPDQIARMAFADIACGSGSFLLEVYDTLLEYHRKWYNANPQKAKKADVEQRDGLPAGQAGQIALSLKKRQEILTNNIYGVDIDFQATEVTQLSLYLKLLEDVTLTQLHLFKEKVLPNLSRNIICGNSLIEPDILETQGSLFVGAIDNSPNVRAIHESPLHNETHLKPMRFTDAFPDVMNRGGFDAIVGNPPYGAEFDATSPTYLGKRFKTFVWRGESYLLFVERALELLRQGGQFGYIIPDTYLNLGFTKALREILLQNTRLREIVRLPSNIFSSAVVDTTLLTFEKVHFSEPFHLTNVHVKLFDKKATILDVNQAPREFDVATEDWFNQNAFNLESDRAEFKVLLKVEKSNKQLSDYAEMFSGIKAYEVGKGKPPQSKQIRDSKPFTAGKRHNSNWAPFFDGKHVGRYELLWQQNNWIHYGEWLAAPRDSENFVGEKLLVRKIVGETLIATYVPETSYCNTLLFVVKVKRDAQIDYRYLLGIINSHFIGWYFRKKFQISVEDTFPQIMIRDILQFPIPESDKARHDQIVKLVEQILAAKEKLAKTKIDAEVNRLEMQCESLDRQIDAAVYELYGLTEEEIKIVEGNMEK